MTAKIHYNSADGTGLVVYPDDIGYATIPEPFIVVDRATMQDVFDNRDRRKVDLKTMQIVHCDPPAPTPPTKEQQIALINAKYQPQFDALKSQKNAAELLGNSVDAIKTQYQALFQSYLAEKKGVQ